MAENLITINVIFYRVLTSGFLMSSGGIESTKFSLPACILLNSASKKLLGVTIDKKLNFNKNVTNLCDKASKKSSTCKNSRI